jgi:hypothetical protein
MRGCLIRSFCVGGIGLWGWGFFGWMLGFTVSSGNAPFVTSSTELPLGHICGVAVDSKGQIYCGLAFYGRIQQYDPNGLFQRGWSANASRGAFRIWVNPQDQLEVVTSRNQMRYVFDAEGNLIDSQSTTAEKFREFDARSKDRCTASNGDVYAVRSSFLFPHIVKTALNGHTQTVVAVPAHKWLYMGPFPAWLFIAAGTFFLLASLVMRRRSTQPEREPNSKPWQTTDQVGSIAPDRA